MREELPLPTYLSPVCTGAGISTFFLLLPAELVAKASQGQVPPPFWISDV